MLCSRSSVQHSQPTVFAVGRPPALVRPVHWAVLQSSLPKPSAIFQGRSRVCDSASGPGLSSCSFSEDFLAAGGPLGWQRENKGFDRANEFGRLHALSPCSHRQDIAKTVINQYIHLLTYDTTLRPRHADRRSHSSGTVVSPGRSTTSR